MNQNCSKCRTDLPEKARFCPSCGKPVSGILAQLKLRHLAFLMLVALAVFALVWTIAGSMLGQGPAQHFTAQDGHSASPADYNDPDLEALRQKTKSQPDSKDNWNSLGKALALRMNESSEVPTALVFELIDVLGQVLRLDARDPEALLGMAEISFSRQAFTKAAEYYKRYLEVNPKDNMSRARYASALTFLGAHEQSVQELNAILLEKPDDFHALAYLSIAHAQAGNTAKAREAGEKALARAPNEEARLRFTRFLDDLKASAAQTDAGKNKLEPQGESKDLDSFLSTIRESPLTGSKLRKHELKGDELWLFFADFPMDKMPEFVREKFLGRMKENAQPLKARGIRSIVLVDESGTRELARIPF